MTRTRILLAIVCAVLAIGFLSVGSYKLYTLSAKKDAGKIQPNYTDTVIQTDTIKNHNHDIITDLMERSYAYGQINALHHDIRIKIIDDSTLTFVKSPWNDCDTNPKAVYHPCSMHDTLYLSTK